MININAVNFQQNEIAVLQQAAALWDQQLNSPVPINLHIESLALPGNLLGLSIPNGVFNVAQGVQNCWYVSALADRLAGQDLQPGQVDAAIYIDSQANWYIGQPQNIQPGEYDFFSNALHEMGHSFGYIGLFNVTPQNNGTYGRITAHDLPPIPLPFVFPNLNGWPSILGLNTLSAQLGHAALVVPGVQCPPQGLAGLGLDLVQPALFRSQQGGTRHVYAPPHFQLFSSFDHLSPAAYPNTLMQPTLPSGITRRVIDADTWDVLLQLGW